MKTLIIAFLFLICAVSLPTYSQTPSCQQDAENQPCNESWQINEKLVWVNLPGRLDCKIPVSVFYWHRCNVFRLGWYQFASIPSSFEQPPGCSNNKDDYYAAMQSAQFQESALTTAIGEHLNYTSPGLPICGQGVPAQALIYTATCYRMVIEYQSFAGSTVTMNYNPALGYQHYEQLMQQYNVVLPPYSVKVLPCGYTCCKQTVSYCKQPPSLAVVTMYGPKVNLSGYCDTDPELFCQTRTCE